MNCKQDACKQQTTIDTDREFKGTETCGHAMIGKGTPLKTSNFLSIFPNETAAYFVISAPPIKP